MSLVQVLTANDFNKFAKYQNCEDCPIKQQCDYATDEMYMVSVCSIIEGDMPGFDNYVDGNMSSPVEG